MKKAFITLFMVSMAWFLSQASGNDVQQARELAHRLSTSLASKVDFKHIESNTDIFSLETVGDKVIISGNNANSMAVGLNRYLNRYCKTTVSWYADISLDLPMLLPVV